MRNRFSELLFGLQLMINNNFLIHLYVIMYVRDIHCVKHVLTCNAIKIFHYDLLEVAYVVISLNKAFEIM